MWCTCTFSHVAVVPTNLRGGCQHNMLPGLITTLQWRHNGRYGVSNHQPHDCLLNRLSFIQAQIKENIKAPRHRSLCGNVTSEFSTQWPVTRKMFSSDYALINSQTTRRKWTVCVWNIRNQERNAYARFVTNESVHITLVKSVKTTSI